METIFQHWDKFIFLGSIAIFFVVWQGKTERAAERQEARDNAILDAIADVITLLKESRTAASSEHAGLVQLFERLDEHTVTEHRLLEKALERLNTSLQHHMDDERARNIKAS